MADEGDGLDITPTVEIANSRLDDFLKSIDSSLGDSAPGVSAAKPEDIVALVFSMQAQYPAQDYVFPDGSHMFASGWILSQAFSDNGDEYIAPFNRFTAQYGGA